MDVSSWQTAISEVIENVKQGRDLTDGTRRLRDIMLQVQEAGADAFVIACTELSILAQSRWVASQMIDASDTLARHCLTTIKKGAA